jgi:hypothetical protein
VVRPANGLLAGTVAVAVAAVWLRIAREDRRPAWIPTAALVAGGVLPCLLWGAYNLRYFGALLRTGYALSAEQGAYEPGRLWKNMPLVVDAFAGNLLPLGFAVGLVGLMALGPKKEALMRWLWFFPITVLYAVYYWASPGLGTAYARFFFALLPLLVACAAMAMARLVGTRKLTWVPLLALTLFVAAVNAGKAGRLSDSILDGYMNRIAAGLTRPLMEHMEPGAVVFAEMPFAYFAGLKPGVVWYDFQAFSPGVERSLRTGRDPSAPRWQRSRNEWLTQTLAGRDYEWLKEQLRARVETALDASKQVLMACARSRSRYYATRLGPGLASEELATWRAPPARHGWTGEEKEGRGQEFILLRIVREAERPSDSE